MGGKCNFEKPLWLVVPPEIVRITLGDKQKRRREGAVFNSMGRSSAA
jgi:hypothetical protein